MPKPWRIVIPRFQSTSSFGDQNAAIGLFKLPGVRTGTHPLKVRSIQPQQEIQPQETRVNKNDWLFYKMPPTRRRAQSVGGQPRTLANPPLGGAALEKKPPNAMWDDIGDRVILGLRSRPVLLGEKIAGVTATQETWDLREIIDPKKKNPMLESI